MKQKIRAIRETRARIICSNFAEGKEHNEAVVKKIEQATANVEDREKY